jgi:thiosulfate/3-mercaptopyruvate sulfurtransferase
LHPDRVVTADEVDARRGQPGFRLLDARAAERYRGEQEPIDPVAGHIPGALSAPFKQNLDADGRFLPPEALHARFEALLQDTPPGESVSYCGSGVTAAHNLLAMAHAGLGDGRLYAGSWSDWITDPYRPVSSGEGG